MWSAGLFLLVGCQGGSCGMSGRAFQGMPTFREGCAEFVMTISMRAYATQLIRRPCNEITHAKASLVFKEGLCPFIGPAISGNWVCEPFIAGHPICPVFGVCRHCSLDCDRTGGWVTILSCHGKRGDRYHGHMVS